jgi:hypothetical protein
MVNFDFAREYRGSQSGTGYRDGGGVQLQGQGTKAFFLFGLMDES